MELAISEEHLGDKGYMTAEKGCVCATQSHVRCILHTRVDKAFVYGQYVEGRRDLMETKQHLTSRKLILQKIKFIFQLIF